MPEDNLTPIGQRHRAYPMMLRGGPKSAQATSLVEHLVHTLLIPAGTRVNADGEYKDPRPSSIFKMRQAAGALLSDLFDFHRGGGSHTQPRLGFHGMSKGNFRSQDLGFAYDVFKPVVRSLTEAGLLDVTLGSTSWTMVFGRLVPVDGSRTVFGLTSAMLDLAAARGVDVEAWATHWRRTNGRPLQLRDDPLVVLRKATVREAGKKRRGEDMPVDETLPIVQEIRAGLQRTNGYLQAQSIGGFDFMGLRRVFSNGDQPDFAWNKGGRFYSRRGGHAYETWSSHRRREGITINGETVTEVDLRASHLTLLHGLLGRPFDAEDDPYEVGELPRAIVKHWVAHAIGASNPRPITWSGTADDAFDDERPGQEIEHDYPVREVGAAIKERHPLMVDLRDCGITALDLQFHEAEILRSAMASLMFDHDVPVLPVHDAFIVPLSQAQTATDLLRQAFVAYVEKMTGHPCLALPKVTIKGQEDAEVLCA